MQKNGDIRRRRAGGFTLSEILITLVIVGFVGALGVPMLGQNKLKKPIDIKARHGTMECFWQGDTLYQHTSNNTNDKKGTLKNVTDQGACYFTAPTANIFILQAVGAGGTGAAGMSGSPRYQSATRNVSGNIPTDQGFLAAMNDDKTPDWVRKEWNNQWSSGKKVKYKIKAPLGGSGNAYCELRRIDVDENNNYNDCPEVCTTDVAEKCPPRCLYTLEERGGYSGNSAEVTVETILEYHPDGQMDNVKFKTDTNESRLTIGAKEAIFTASEKGTSATSPSFGVVERGEDGKHIRNQLDAHLSLSGMDRTGSVSTITKQSPGTGCDNPAGRSAQPGSISVVSPTSIQYRTQSLAVNAYFGTAGSPGSVDMKMMEKLPENTQFMLVPAKQSSGSEDLTHSRIYKKNDDGTWVKFLEAGSGGNGSARWEVIPIEEGDLPFPKVYYPHAFRPSKPDLAISAGSGYTSYIAKNNYMPGAAGGGAHPIITSVTGNAQHYINGVATGNEGLTPITGNDSTCYSGWTTGSGSCGSGNNIGNPGAAVISW